MAIASSELVLNPDGSIYHLKLLPEQLADDILIVGDQGRVNAISSLFDTIEHQVSNREFVTHTGTYKGKRISAISTGIGPDNIDIVINELDALVNIDLKQREIKPEKKSLNIIRIGTSGTLQSDIPVDSVVVSKFGLGLDGVLHYYKHKQTAEEHALETEFLHQVNLPEGAAKPYFVKSSDKLFDLLAPDHFTGITATAGGFYGPQGRRLRLDCAIDNLNEQLTAFHHSFGRITNFEMETSALYGLAKLLGHNACTACAIIANRANLTYSKDYKPVIAQLIKTVLDRIVNQ
jgi:uridine phosphorylase